MAKGGLYSGFDAYRVLSSADIQAALHSGTIAFDTNVLLNLYRYNDKTVDDLLRIVEAASDRFFIPHQVVREFWRNRQAVIASLGSASSEAHSALAKNAKSSSDAISRWARSVALPAEDEGHLQDEVDAFYLKISERISEAPPELLAHAPTADDPLLAKLEVLLEGRVGEPLSQEDWEEAVKEGERRVENSIPPGYMDIDKLESNLPEGASGDYLVWLQLLNEGATSRRDLVLITSDTKEDWWNRSARGAVVGARRELIDEYLKAAGCRFFILEPADLVKHSLALGIGISIESVHDIERIRDEETEQSAWTPDAVRLVLRELDAQGCIQGRVIREAAGNGGRISRARVYELDNRDPGQMLRGFTRPVTRVTAELQAAGEIPRGVPPLLDAVYEDGMKSSHFSVPHEVVGLLEELRDA